MTTQDTPDFSRCCGDVLPSGECCAAVYGTDRLDPIGDEPQFESEHIGPQTWDEKRDER